MLLAEEPRSMVHFNHFEDKYKCCCKTAHVRQGALLVGLINAVCLIYALFNPVFDTSHIVLIVFGHIENVVAVVCIILLFIGIVQERSALLLPYIFFTIYSLVECVVIFALTLYIIVEPNNSTGEYLVIGKGIRKDLEEDTGDLLKDHPDAVTRMTHSIMAISLIIAMIVHMWFFYIVYRCFCYLRDYERHRERKRAAFQIG